ncbi:unnamed protein product [Sphenostylis stenocarpa]|uniref:Uncharacterized protein n=1 Tax=Sphenostylis stenocarpa TaxID=92480 RepID=A0AA86VKD6_9FABA|nr:unnamed protein product [Sphenostylis stenocarpa]
MDWIRGRNLQYIVDRGNLHMFIVHLKYSHPSYLVEGIHAGFEFKIDSKSIHLKQIKSSPSHTPHHTDCSTVEPDLVAL